MSNNHNNNNDIPAPPPYSRIDYNQSPSGMQLPTIPMNDMSVNCKLPSYEEVQMEKILNDEPIPINTLPPMRVAPLQNDMTFIAIDNGDEITSDDNGLLGTDIVSDSSSTLNILKNLIKIFS